ncbi:MAG: PP2C family protein-serine/threonine phosphatase [Bacteroidales bacterium]|nr:PP2C family protein-serine/threonine phosphatase [Bacteroidales bacterium]
MAIKAKASLKRLQFCNFKLDFLLDITLAINDNLPTNKLLKRYETILKNELNIGKVLIYSYNEKWEKILSSGVEEKIIKKISVERDLLLYTQITNLTITLNPILSYFDVIIPIFHHESAIAYLIIGDIDEERTGISPTIKHLHFIQTITNIMIVAIENRRLFNENVKQEAIKKELELASKMQTMLIPDTDSLPENKNLHVSAYYLPHYDVGGDYYDFIQLNGNEYGFCIADVSGKGISAALLMSNFQANIRALFNSKISLPSLVRKLNETVMDNANGEKFITLFIAKYNTSTRELRYINAGHNPSIFFNGKNKTSSYLQKGCIGVGMMDEIPVINEDSLIVENNSRILCYTDGLVELENENQIEFGTKIMEESVAKKQKINKVIDEIILKVNEHKGNSTFFDDISIIGIEFF